jgi:uncharacterized membrane protein
MKKVLELIRPQVVGLGMVVVAALGLFLIGHKNYSMDELDTIFTIKDLPMLGQVMWFREGNMWLYYTLLYFWGLVSHAEAWVRAFSVVWAVATVPVAYALTREMFDVRVARLTTLLLAVHTFLIFNAQNARGYTLVLFLSTLATYCFVRYMKTGARGYLAGAAVLNVLAVYTHLYAALIIGAQFLAVLWWRQKARRPEVLGVYALTGAALLPLVLAPAYHAQPVAWIPVPGVRNLIGTFIILANDFVPIAGLYGGLLVVTVARLWRQRVSWRPSARTWPYALAVLMVAVPVAVSFGFSVVVKPLYISAYFFVCLVPFTMLMAASLLAVRRPVARLALVSLVVVLAGVRLAGWYTGSHALELVIPNNTEDWSKAAAYLSAHAQSQDAVLFFPSMDRDKVNYYLDKGQPSLHNEIILQPYFLTTGQAVRTYDNAKLESLGQQYQRVWFVLERVTGKDTAAETAVIERSLQAHYHVKQVERVEFLEIYEYER